MPGGAYPLGAQRIDVRRKRSDRTIKMPTAVASAFNSDGAFYDDRHSRFPWFEDVCTTGPDKSRVLLDHLGRVGRVILITFHQGVTGGKYGEPSQPSLTVPLLLNRANFQLYSEIVDGAALLLFEATLSHYCCEACR